MTIVNENIREQIDARLTAVAAQRGLRILYACESGSRAWGFASQDSDYDVRFLFVRQPAEYLRLKAPADAFDLPLDGDLDLAGWDIRKTCELMKKSNPPLYEWLGSPVVYRSDATAVPELKRLAGLYFCPKKMVYHYLNLARGTWDKYLADRAAPVLKKYLYALRPLAAIRYIALAGKQPPTRFDAVLAGIDWPNDVMARVDDIVARKKQAAELDSSPADALLNRHIVESMAAAESLAASLQPNGQTNAPLDQFIAACVLDAQAGA